MSQVTTEVALRRQIIKNKSAAPDISINEYLPQMYENTRLGIENACFGIYLGIVQQKIKTSSQAGDF